MAVEDLQEPTLAAASSSASKIPTTTSGPEDTTTELLSAPVVDLSPSTMKDDCLDTASSSSDASSYIEIEYSTDDEDFFIVEEEIVYATDDDDVEEEIIIDEEEEEEDFDEEVTLSDDEEYDQDLLKEYCSLYGAAGSTSSNNDTTNDDVTHDGSVVFDLDKLEALRQRRSMANSSEKGISTAFTLLALGKLMAIKNRASAKVLVAQKDGTIKVKKKKKKSSSDKKRKDSKKQEKDKKDAVKKVKVKRVTKKKEESSSKSKKGSNEEGSSDTATTQDLEKEDKKKNRKSKVKDAPDTAPETPNGASRRKSSKDKIASPKSSSKRSSRSAASSPSSDQQVLSNLTKIMSPRKAPPRLSAVEFEKLSMSMSTLEVQTVSDLGVNDIPLPPMFSPQQTTRKSLPVSSLKDAFSSPMLDNNNDSPLPLEGKVATPAVQELRKSFSSADPQVQQFLRSPTAKLGLSIVSRKSIVMSPEKQQQYVETEGNDAIDCIAIQAPPLLDDDVNNVNNDDDDQDEEKEAEEPNNPETKEESMSAKEDEVVEEVGPLVPLKQDLLDTFNIGKTGFCLMHPNISVYDFSSGKIKTCRICKSENNSEDKKRQRRSMAYSIQAVKDLHGSAGWKKWHNQMNHIFEDSDDEDAVDEQQSPRATRHSVI